MTSQQSWWVSACREIQATQAEKPSESGSHHRDCSINLSSLGLERSCIYWQEETFGKKRHNIQTTERGGRDKKRHILLLSSTHRALEWSFGGDGGGGGRKSLEHGWSSPLVLPEPSSSYQGDAQSVPISSEHLPYTEMRNRCTVQSSNTQNKQQHRERGSCRDQSDSSEHRAGR